MAEPTFRQRRLGEAVKLLRERAGLSQREASDRIDYNVPKLSRIENGQVPDIHALRTMLDVYGVIGDDVEPYLEMWRLAKEKGWWKQYRLEDQGYISLEHDASAISEFQSSYIPGMVQSKGYMRAVFAGARTQRSKKWIDNQIAVRVRRQERLVGDDPVRYHAIIAESALRHAAREQLTHIAALCRLPNVTIQVVLDMVGLHDGHNGSFTLLDFPFAGDPQVLYVEHAGGSMHIEDQSRVKATTLTFKHLSKLALTPRRVRRVDRGVGCREVGIQVSAVWRKSSRSNNGGNGNCVEIALNGSVARVRDSKNQTSSVVAAPHWAAFISAVKRGDLEKN